ncbi:MAG: DUF2169 domain-containing protein [Rubrivivax sp.]|nr:DUF2169 domain-containing protein [Rubrivivax sp.]
MLQVVNHTPFVAALSVFPDAGGIETAYATVKATFSLASGEPEPAAAQLPLLPADVFWADPATSSLRAAGEFGLLKPATDVLLTGRAIAPDERTRVADVALSVGPVTRTVRVFGDRQWRKSGGRWGPGDPAPWSRMPLRWELAFGGVVTEGDTVREHEPRNPVGRGLVAKGTQPAEGQALPNLEDPAEPLADPEQRPTPACFAPVAPTWAPRRQYAGTYDEAWTKGRAPYLPLDFDTRFFQLAPPGLVAPGHLQGGEPVRIAGCTGDGVLTFTLPRCELQLDFDFDGGTIPRVPQLELVLLEPDAARVQLLWRAAFAVDKKLLRLSRVVVRSARHERRPAAAPASPAGAAVPA